MATFWDGRGLESHRLTGQQPNSRTQLLELTGRRTRDTVTVWNQTAIGLLRAANGKEHGLQCYRFC